MTSSNRPGSISAVTLTTPLYATGRYPYTTSFPSTENPLSEGGRWFQMDTVYGTVCRVDNISGVNVAHGTQSGGAYDDSQMHLQGFRPNQWIQATVWKDPTLPSGAPWHEVEVLLRYSSDNPLRTPGVNFGSTKCDGYEININNSGNYLNVGRYKEDSARMTVTPPTAVTGDLFYAEIRTQPNGSARIIVKWNSVTQIDYTDPSPVLTGSPGIGFYIDTGGNNARFGFSAITAGVLDT